MMRTILLPGSMLLLGVAAGGGAGLLLKPDQPSTAATAGKSITVEPGHHSDPVIYDGKDSEIVKLNNQFVIPVVKRKLVAAMVVLSLSIETAAGHSSDIYEREPKLRDALLQALFDHANMGGFDGEFTEARQMDMLRDTLLSEARHVLDGAVQRVLITDIARQDI